MKFALAGNPNCGKTTLFNSLTGSTAHVGNWPGVTVDKREGVYKNKSKDVKVSIVDLPGIYSLSPYTPEEVISRNFILDEKPDCVIDIVDATNLERNLYLTTQLLEMDTPLVVALNMMDLVDKNGDKIDEVKLSEELGVPVIKISALKNSNLDFLMDEAIKVAGSKREGKTVLKDGNLAHLINDVSIAFEGKGVENPLFHAIKLIENDEIETKNHEDLVPMVEKYKAQFKDDVFGNDFEAIVADERYKYITKNYAPTLTKQEYVEVVNEKGETKKKKKATLSDKIDKVLTNRWAGIPIFLVILFFIFHFTFSEDIFWIGTSGVFENVAPSFEGSAYEGLIWHSGGINSIGVILQSLLTNTTDLLSELVGNGLTAINSPEWVSGLLVDGILGGLFSVLSFLPQILLLFLFFSILEDSGYMARVAFILDRMFRKFGLSGRAFMPMIMGFGCSVPAMINTRTLSDDKERTATVRVIPFFSCGAKLPILTAIAGGIITMVGMSNADVITYSMYLLGVIVAICSVLLMRNTTMRGKVPPFIMELPSYHLPQFRSLMIHLWDKLKHFVKKAFTIILLSTILIWFLSNFGWDWSYVGSEGMDSSILASLGKLIQPLFTPLGFGSQLSSFGWVFAVAAVTGLIAKENVIATFFTLACCIVSSINAKFGGDVNDAIVNVCKIAAQSEDSSLIEALLTAIQNLNQADFDSAISAIQTADTSLVGEDWESIFTTDNVTALTNLFNELKEAGTDSELMNDFNILVSLAQNNGEWDAQYLIGVLSSEEASEEGINETMIMIRATGINIPGLLSFIAFNMLTIPCFAACATAKAELPKGKFWSTILFWVATSYIVSTMVYLIGSWWWTCFIFAALIAGAIVVIIFINKHIDKKNSLKFGA